MNRRFGTILACNLCVIIATAVAVELLQLLVSGRYVDVTDVLLATLGGMTGILLQPKFLPRLRPQAIG
jgi:glycopeptide antibiotics resistance protein